MPSTLDQQVSEQGLFALFKGDSGAGKSVGALSWPKPYVFDFDRKMPGIAKKHFPDKAIDYDIFNNIFDIQTKMNEFIIDCPYETLIFDSITTLVVNILNSMGQIKGDDPVGMMKNLKPTKGGKMQAELMGFDYYNAETNFIERYWLDACKGLWARAANPKNIIIIAHVMTTDYSNVVSGIQTQTRRIVTAGRAVAAYIPTQFDDVWVFGHDQDLESGKVQRIALTQNFGIDSAKTSYRLPYKIDFTGTPPNYEDGNLYEKFRKAISHEI